MLYCWSEATAGNLLCTACVAKLAANELDDSRWFAALSHKIISNYVNYMKQLQAVNVIDFM